MQRGFSLVELSIVLVILGLLTGGILAGQSLIRAAELRAISTEYSRYITASQTFRDKYFAVPGDFRDATKFWGYQSGAGCITNSAVSPNPAGTCDGNGDAALTFGAASQSGEVFQFWRHLAMAGLIEGTYTGLAGSGGSLHTTFNSNIPASKLGSSGWAIRTVTTYVAGDANNFAGNYGTYFIFGAALANDLPYTASLQPEEAWNIDTKVDDGKPSTGKVIANWRTACANSASASDTAATYKLDTRSAVCSLFFIQAL